MKSRLDKTVWAIFFSFLPVKGSGLQTPACRVHLRRPVQTLDVQTQPEQPKETFFRSQNRSCRGIRNTKSVRRNTKQENLCFFSFCFFLLLPCGHTRLHIVTLYSNTTCVPCLPSLFPCTDNDCIWSHSFIFYIMIGGFNLFSGVVSYFLCFYFENGFDRSLYSACGRACVCTVAY